MEWNKYQKKFREVAEKEGKSKKYCDEWLEYAQNLWKNNFPIIYNQEHLCGLLGYSATYVYAVSNSPIHFYRMFEIPKKAGGYRQIAEPLPNLKEIQKWILVNILEKMEVSPYAKAYIRGKSIKENVKFHRNQKIVLSLDIQDFFGSLSSAMVYEKFLNVGYHKDVAMMLTGLCCLQGSLPQGAPTSALLSNVLMKPFDDAISAYTNRCKIRYTRYADDMTFSGDFDIPEMIRYVRKVLKDFGLRLNNNKTRVRKQGQRQEVTGIVVNKYPQVPRDVRRKVRQEMFYIQKHGLESHLEFIGEKRQNYLQHIQGVIGYVLFVNPKDKEMAVYKTVISDLIREYNNQPYSN